MKVVLTNLSNQLFESSRLRLNESAIKFGITDIESYDFEDLKSTAFYQQNKFILDQPKGIGYWCWKPYIILEAMKKLQEGDIVIYSDCGIEIIDKLDPLIAICATEQPVLLFGNGNLLNARWTKRDCFVFMEADSKQYWYSIQCDAAFSLFRKSAKSQAFLEDWLTYACNKYIITDLPNTSGKKNLPGFIEHRWDQSVLSLLAIKHAVPFYRVPTQYGNHYKMEAYRINGEFNCVSQRKQEMVRFYSSRPYLNSPYFQLLNHHRTKKNAATIISKKQPVLEKLQTLFVRRWDKLKAWLHYRLNS